jgi:uncharacterized protein YodC (DUF2158 family)
MSDFNKGDLVFHKSGGPKMVVVNPTWKASATSLPQVFCRWWGTDKFEFEKFEPNELKHSKSD